MAPNKSSGISVGGQSAGLPHRDFSTSAASSRKGSSSAGLSESAGGMERLRGQAASQLASQKDRAADGLGSVVQAVRQAGQQLRPDNEMLAAYADDAAAHLERWSRQLRERDIPALVDDVKRFARRRPALFLGGGFVVGLLAVRFLKSSRIDHADSHESSQTFTATTGGVASTAAGGHISERQSSRSTAQGESARTGTKS